MHQASLDSVGLSQESASYISTLRVLKTITHQSPRWQVLILLDSLSIEIVVANTAFTVESCNKRLVETHSKLRVESVHKVWNGVSMSTKSVASAAELEIIKQ